MGNRLMVTVSALLALQGCYEDPDTCGTIPADIEHELMQVDDAWDAYHGPPDDDRCVGVRHVVELVAQEGDFEDVCDRPDDPNSRLVGCSAYDQFGIPHIWILACQRDPAATIRHERAHTRAECEGEPHADHTQPWWGEVAPL